jgi:hypothetical protein
MSVVSQSPAGVAERMGVRPGSIVMEIGYEDDCDEQLRDAIVDRTGDDMVDPESDEVIDVVLLWFREGDGDLTDALVDAIAPLADDGVIWLMTPKRGRPGYVEPSDVAEAASVAGLSQTSITAVSVEWTGARLVGRRSGGKR